MSGCAVTAPRNMAIGRSVRVIAELLAEIGPRCRLDAIGPVSEVDRVQVLGQDLDLGPLMGQLEGERGFLELLEDRPVLGRRVLLLPNVLDELFGDRRGALSGPSRQVGKDRSRDSAQVDPGIAPVALVLDRDDRVDHPGRDLLPLVDHLVVGRAGGARSVVPDRRRGMRSGRPRTLLCSQAGAGPKPQRAASRRRLRSEPAPPSRSGSEACAACEAAAWVLRRRLAGAAAVARVDHRRHHASAAGEPRSGSRSARAPVGSEGQGQQPVRGRASSCAPVAVRQRSQPDAGLSAAGLRGHCRAAR